MEEIKIQTKRVCELQRHDVFVWMGRNFLVYKIDTRVFYESINEKYSRSGDKSSFGRKSQMKVEVLPINGAEIKKRKFVPKELLAKILDRRNKKRISATF